jgi:hypothetical protein
MLSGLIHIAYHYQEGIPIKTPISLDSLSGDLFILATLIIGVFIGFVVFTPKGTKEITKESLFK